MFNIMILSCSHLAILVLQNISDDVSFSFFPNYHVDQFGMCFHCLVATINFRKYFNVCHGRQYFNNILALLNSETKLVNSHVT